MTTELPAVANHIAVPSNAKPNGPPKLADVPIVYVFKTLPVLVSIFMPVPLPLFATQMFVPSKETLSGSGPTVKVPVTAPVAAVSRVIVPASAVRDPHVRAVERDTTGGKADRVSRRPPRPSPPSAS